MANAIPSHPLNATLTSIYNAYMYHLIINNFISIDLILACTLTVIISVYLAQEDVDISDKHNLPEGLRSAILVTTLIQVRTESVQS